MPDIEALREKEAQTRYACAYRELDGFHRGRVDSILAIEREQAKQLAHEERVGARSGISQKQLDYIADKIWSALTATDVLSDLVVGQVRAALPALLEPLIRDALAQLEMRTSSSVESAIAAAESATTAIERAASGGDSHRVERLSEHISRIETRLQKLERK